jgi:hypothetical protein
MPAIVPVVVTRCAPELDAMSREDEEEMIAELLEADKAAAGKHG